MFKQKRDQFTYQQVIKRWRYYTAYKKRKNRLRDYSTNFITRNAMRRFFEGWRRESHQMFKERIEREKGQFQLELESKILNTWQSKVDALTLYFGQLEEKIHREQEAREKLAILYDQSLSLGCNRLTEETKVLASNPLVHEVIIKKDVE